jgi:hypothetical protein
MLHNPERPRLLRCIKLCHPSVRQTLCIFPDFRLSVPSSAFALENLVCFVHHWADITLYNGFRLQVLVEKIFIDPRHICLVHAELKSVIALQRAA